jgi:hypothetical protein
MRSRALLDNRLVSTLRALSFEVPSMRLLSALSLVVLLVVVVGCSPAAPPAPAAAAPQVKANLNQVMRGILFPNSNIIFDAQDTDPGAPPAPAAAGSNPYAGTYGGWEAVENASMALAEAANLISLPGRVCQNNKPVPLDDPVYQKGLAALREVAQLSYDTAKARKYDADAMLNVADKVTQACATCHDVFRDRVVDGKPIGMEDRCTKG